MAIDHDNQSAHNVSDSLESSPSQLWSPEQQRANRQNPMPEPLPPSQCVVLVPVGSSIEPGCEDSLRQLERRGYPVWRVRGFAAINQGRPSDLRCIVAIERDHGERTTDRKIEDRKIYADIFRSSMFQC